MKHPLTLGTLSGFLVLGTAIASNTSLTYLSSDDALERYKNSVILLSSQKMDGRGIGTTGLNLAEDYVEQSFRDMGLQPFAPAALSGFSPDFRHSVPVLTGINVVTAELQTTNPLTLESDFIPASISANDTFEGEIVNAGFGTVIPEIGHDDYTNIDLSGKIALIKRHLPDNALNVDKQKEYSDLFYKASLAKERGAKAILFWDADASSGDTLPSLSKQYRTSSLPILYVSRTQALQWIENPSAVNISGKVELRKVFSPARNVVGSLGGNCSSSGNAILIGAHLDHLGWGDSSSLEPSQKGLHPGADDNASGVAGVLEAAHIIRTTLSSGELESRCFVFAAFTAEEQGIIGSNALMAAWRKQNWKPKAMINLDMVGRLKEQKLTSFGLSSAKEWNEILPALCEKSQLQCVASDDTSFGRSDHVAFLLAGVPSIHFQTGTHPDYHRSSDTAEKINFEGGARIANLSANLAIAATSPSLTFLYIAAPPAQTGGDLPTRGAYLGTMPDYSGGSLPIPGVLLSGAVPGSPAEKAGVLPSDILLAIDEHQTPNIDEFMNVLRTLRPGDIVVLRIYRNGQTLALQATVGSRKR
jgi:hypothetical protein